ncbi:unnamed protein product [Caenorhabditis auriculariae]|uniref:glutathione gamma-glutamylcysteinyltransferase n=1 Tax=Caenorhabditis auriculariae TaxID=2777116 RepID=A0A8S1HJU9_9PELO|nr:unnamed protein product [Caenorhabditis auriculariae]
MSVTAKNFYRRPLPDSCVDFASALGKKLFSESLQNGCANIYFKLASQFLTQDEPAYCGLSTLVMVLNALEVDPERVWKAPWRFYHESMLDCCVPLENVKRTGINLAQFGCLAICNRLNTRVMYGNDSNEFLVSLRKTLVESVRGDDTVVVASYDRSALGQTGAGHFSPLAAYHEESDRVLIMDVARFKYPPHWVSLVDLQKALCSVDPSTKKPRGYVILNLRSGTRPLIMFGLKANLAINDSEYAMSVIAWKEFLLCDPLSDEKEEFQLCCRRFGQCFAPHALCCTQKIAEADLRSRCKEGVDEHSEACKTIYSEIRQTPFAQVFSSSAVAALMLAWPYEPSFSERSDRLYILTNEQKSRFSMDTQNEIEQLTVQISTLICCTKSPPQLSRNGSASSKCSRSKQANGLDPCSCQCMFLSVLSPCRLERKCVLADAVRNAVRLDSACEAVCKRVDRHERFLHHSPPAEPSSVEKKSASRAK